MIVSLGGCELLVTEYSEDPEPPEPNVCASSLRPTPGELGRLSFGYDYGDVLCTLGCSADEPIAERSQVQIQAFGSGELPPLKAVSDAPEVATFSIGNDGDIHVETHATGDVRVELRDEDDELVEALALRVKAVHDIELTDDSDSVVIMSGGSDYIGLDLLDEDGCRMVGVGGVDYVLEGPVSESGEWLLIELAVEWIFEPWFGNRVDEGFWVQSEEEGEGQILVRAPSEVERAIPVAVVDASAVAEVVLPQPDVHALGETPRYSAHAYDAEGTEVRDPDCTWSIEPSDGPVQLGDIGRDSVELTSTVPAQAVVTCQVGTALASMPVAFE